MNYENLPLIPYKTSTEWKTIMVRTGVKASWSKDSKNLHWKQIREVIPKLAAKKKENKQRKLRAKQREQKTYITMKDKRKNEEWDW